MNRPPKYVQAFIDRHGHARYYFRRTGFMTVPLPGLPWSPQFMEAYERAISGEVLELELPPRVKPGSFRALAISYFRSSAFTDLKPSTQSVYRNAIERLCKEHGDKGATNLQREHVVKLMNAKSGKPESANMLRKIIRAMMTHAVDIGLRRDDPTREVRKIKSKNKDGYHSWTDEEVARFERRHPVGSKARLALALLAYTGQRRSDVVLMGRQHLRTVFENGEEVLTLYVKQQKTGVECHIPVLPQLAAAIAERPLTDLTFLTTQFGKGFTAAGFGNWFREQCDMAGLHHCSAHGLRKAAARRFAEAGFTTHEVAAWTGHDSLREVERYTRAANRRMLALAGLRKIKA
jgi:integrase